MTLEHEIVSLIIPSVCTPSLDGTQTEINKMTSQRVNVIIPVRPSMLVIQKLDGVDDFLKYERVYGDEFVPG